MSDDKTVANMSQYYSLKVQNMDNSHWYCSCYCPLVLFIHIYAIIRGEVRKKILRQLNFFQVQILSQLRV